MVILYQLLVHIICWTVRITVVKCKSFISHAHSKVPSWHCAGKTGETIKIKLARVSVQMHTRAFWREVIYKYITTCPNQLLFKFLYLCSINFQWQLLFNHIYFHLQLHMFITEVVAVLKGMWYLWKEVWHVKGPSLEC